MALVAPSDLLAIRIFRDDEVEFVRRTEWYVKLQMILFHVVNLRLVAVIALSGLLATHK